MTRRRWVVLGCALLGAATDCASTPPTGPSAGANARADPTRVAGRVVELGTARPLAGRTVLVAGRSAVTDADGWFALDGVPPRYDAVVIEPDRAVFTFFRGLRRRDPVLVHRSHESALGRRITSIKSALRGGSAPALDDYLGVYFVAPRASDSVYLSAGDIRQGWSPSSAPLRISWNGGERLTGDLIYVELTRAKSGATASLARRTITLQSEPPIRAVSMDDLCAPHAPVAPPPPVPQVTLDLEPVPIRHLSLASRVPRSQDVGVFYRLAASGVEIELPPQRMTRCEPTPPVELDVPELLGLGATLCVRVADGQSSAETCGEPSDLRVVPEMRPTPALSEPRETWGGLHRLVAQTTPLAWSRHDGAIARLDLVARFPSAETPTLVVYTEAASEAWPALADAGLSFPADFLTYEVQITELAPFATLDTALGPGGIGALSRKESYRSASHHMRVLTTPTGGAPVECESPRLSCGPAAPVTGNPCDDRHASLRLRLEDINRKLGLHPRLVSAFGKSCARDCADIHAFEATYREFARRRPGFDANDPVYLPGWPPPVPAPQDR